MVTLTLRIRDIGDSTPDGGAMVAELLPLEPKAGRRRSVTIMPSDDNEVRGLEPGNWEVRLVTPSGVIVSKDVDLSSGEDRTIGLSIPASTVQPARTKPTPSPRTTPPRPRKRGGLMSLRSGLGGREDRYAGGSLDQAERTPESLIGRVPENASAISIVRCWERLAAGARGEVDATVMLDAVRNSTPAVPVELASGRWQIPAAQEADDHRRVWVVAAASGGRRIHSLPAPWPIEASGRTMVFTTGIGDAGWPRSGIRLQDDRFAGLVAYLANGTVATAARLLRGDDDQLLDLASETLRGKRGNPLGAAAAAYVLVGSSNLSRPEPWHDWVANLGRLFPWLPDASILVARLKLLTARSEEEAREALVPVRRALGVGLPYYSVGLGWLLATMAFFEDDDLVAKVLPSVRRVSASLDMDAPFTTLDIPPA